MVYGDGLIPDWNEDFPDQEVQQGDWMVRVNGQSGAGNAAELNKGKFTMVDGVLQMEMKIEFCRDCTWPTIPGDATKKWKVTIDPAKSKVEKKLGLDLNKATQEVKAIYTGTMMQEWNRNFPKLAVWPGDRILQVNGKSGKELLQ